MESIPRAMSGAACVDLLQWALPRLHLQWAGFRRVRRQVCRRIDGRVKELGLPGVPAYRRFLEAHPEEWKVLDAFCLISVSRFARDRDVFERLGATVLPELGAAAARRGSGAVRAWSAGCASGEEPYTLALYWHFRVEPLVPRIPLRIVATDLDPNLLARAAAAAYSASSLRELPTEFREAGFCREGRLFILRDEFRDDVELLRQDLRHEAPSGAFDLVLCRNAAFTYFDPALQRRTLERMLERMNPRGAFVIGGKERLPESDHGVEPWFPTFGIYRNAQVGGDGAARLAGASA